MSEYLRRCSEIMEGATRRIFPGFREAGPCPLVTGLNRATQLTAVKMIQRPRVHCRSGLLKKGDGLALPFCECSHKVFQLKCQHLLEFPIQNAATSRPDRLQLPDGL